LAIFKAILVSSSALFRPCHVGRRADVPVGAVWGLGTFPAMFPCRVPGCGRALRSLAGESVPVSAMHSTDAPVELEPSPIHTLCVDSEYNDVVMVEHLCDAFMLGSDAGAEANLSLSAASPAGGAVRTVVGLPSEVFLELSRALTAHPPSTRSANAQRKQPSNSERRARCAIGKARGRRRRRRRGGREGGAVKDERHSGEEGSQQRRVDGATTPSTSNRDARAASDAELEGGDDRDQCDDVFKRYERFGDARKATEAFPQQQGRWERRGRQHEPWTHDELWHVLVRACNGGGVGDMSQNEL